jgi:outer membrane protein assembly factor BamB
MNKIIMMPRSYNVIFLLLTLFMLSSASPAPCSPFRETWCYEAPEPLIGLAGGDGKVFFSTMLHIGALDEKTGSLIWMHETPVRFPTLTKDNCFSGLPGVHIACDGSFVFFSFEHCSVDTYDARSGKRIRSLPLTCRHSAIAADRGRLVCMPKPAQLTVIDSRTGRELWKRQITKMERSWGRDHYELHQAPVITGNRLAILNGGKVICFDMDTGNMLWSQELSCRSLTPMAEEEVLVVVTENDTVKALAADSGRVRWKTTLPTYGNPPVAVSGGDLCISDETGTLTCIQGKNGLIRWKKNVSSSPGPGTSVIPREGGVLAAGGHDLSAMSREGRELWRAPFGPGLEWGIVKPSRYGLIVASDELICALHASPTETTEQPETPGLNAYPSPLSARSRHLLLAMGNSAFPVIYKAARDFHSQLIKSNGTSPGAQEASLQGLQDSLELLACSAEKENSIQVSELTELLGNLDRDRVLTRWLANKGEPSIADLFFLKKLPPSITSDRRSYLPVLRGLQDYSMRLSQGDCMKALLQELDLWPVPPCRILPCDVVMEDSEIRATLRAPVKTRIIPSTIETLALEEVWQRAWKVPGNSRPFTDPYRTGFVAMGRDRQGKIWGLFNAHLRGFYGEAWVAERRGGRWRDPRWISHYMEAKDAPHWIARWAGDREGLTDSDKDGLPDCIEKKFATDPFNEDSDRDGLVDSLDKNPLAAPRYLTDEEEVMKAAFEWRASRPRFGPVPWVVDLPAGVKPFEIGGLNWVTLMTEAHRSHPPARPVRRGILDMAWHQTLPYTRDKRPVS